MDALRRALISEGLTLDATWQYVDMCDGVETVTLQSDGTTCQLVLGDEGGLRDAVHMFATEVKTRRVQREASLEQEKKAQASREAARSLVAALGRLPKLRDSTCAALRTEYERVQAECDAVLRPRVVTRVVVEPGDATLWLELTNTAVEENLCDVLSRSRTFRGVRVCNRGTYRFAFAHFGDVSEPEELLRDRSILTSLVTRIAKSRDHLWRNSVQRKEETTKYDGDDVEAMERCAKTVAFLHNRLYRHHSDRAPLSRTTDTSARRGKGSLHPSRRPALQ